jgi:Tol biopolymer transport system component
MSSSQLRHRTRTFAALVTAGFLGVVIVPRVASFASGFWRGSANCASWETPTAGASGLWVITPDGAVARRLVDGNGGGISAWAPDGSRIAFVDQTDSAVTNRIVVVRPDGTDQHDVSVPAEQPADATSPVPPGPISALSWSPDGSRLVFAVPRLGGSTSIYEARPDGTDLRLLAQPASFNGWSPDLTRLLVVTTEYTPLPEGLPVGSLYSTRLDGSDKTLLARGPGRIMDPAWSPDGTRVAFSADTKGRLDGLALNVVNADGTGRRTVAQSDQRYLEGAAWSPNSQWLAFDNYPHEDWGWLGVVRADGRQRHNVTGELGKPVIHDATWSPDGTEVAYVNGRGLAIVDRSGHNDRCLQDAAPAAKPVWSPDGRHIAFVRYDAR